MPEAGHGTTQPPPGIGHFTIELRVRYAETDPQQFVFNSRYLEYADVALTEYFRWLGWGYLELLAEGCDPSLVRTALQFKAPARLDDLLTLAVACTRLGTSSFDLLIDISRDGQAICSIQTTYVNVDTVSARAVPVPERIAKALSAQLGAH